MRKVLKVQYGARWVELKPRGVLTLLGLGALWWGGLAWLLPQVGQHPAPERRSLASIQDLPSLETRGYSALGRLTARVSGQAAVPLALVSAKVEARIAGGLASTSIEHTFRSDLRELSEGRYEITIPKGASVERYALADPQGGWLEGRFVERERARRAYESYLPEKRDPGLVEWQDGQRFSARVFPIAAYGQKRVAFGYTQPALAESGWVRWQLPLRGAGRDLERFEATIRIQAPGVATEGVYLRSVPEGTVSLRREGDEVVVRLACAGPLPDRLADEVITIDVARPSGTGPRLLMGPARAQGPRHGLILLDPQAVLGPAESNSEAREASGADFVFVVDRSGSMNHAQRWTQASLELAQALQNLGPRDRFAVLTFSDAADLVTGGFLPADRQTASDLARNLLLRGAQGGTEYAQAFAASAGLIAGRDDASRPVQVVLITDGVDFRGLKVSPGGPLFVVPVGTSDRQGLDLCARARGGQAVGSALEAIALAPHRALAEVRVVEPELAGLHPARVRVFERRQELAFAFACSEAPERLVLELAQPGHQPRRITLALGAPQALAPERAGRIWARARIEDLLANPSHHQDELTRLGLSYRFVTPFTSLLVLESEDEYRRWGLETAPQNRAQAQSLAEFATQRDRALAIVRAPKTSAEGTIVLLEEEVGLLQGLPKGTDLTNLSNKNLESTSVVDTFGVGGGAAGAYGGRWGKGSLARTGGTESAVAATEVGALAFLKQRQAPDGSWNQDLAQTSLSLLSYLSNGHTHRFGRYKRTVSRGLRWLRLEARAHDRFAGAEPRARTLTTLALCEAYAMSRDFTLKRAVERALIECVAVASRPTRLLADDSRRATLDLGWLALALEAGAVAGFDVAKQALPQLAAALEQHDQAEPVELAPTQAALRVLVGLYAGRSRTDAWVQAAGARVRAPDFGWSEQADPEAWHLSALACFQLGGASWKRCAAGLQQSLLPHQQSDGSWLPPAAAEAERIEATALASLLLETCYRYERVQGSEGGGD